MAAKYQIVDAGRTWAVECAETGITYDRGGQGFTAKIDAEQFIKEALISDAAPELLSALKAVLAKLEGSRGIFEIPVEESQIRAAIAKAEGRP